MKKIYKAWALIGVDKKLIRDEGDHHMPFRYVAIYPTKWDAVESRRDKPFEIERVEIKILKKKQK